MKTTIWAIELGEDVLDLRTGRIGRTTQVNTKIAFVRFEEGAKAFQIDRTRLISLRTVVALREVDEDEANAAAYRSWVIA